MVKVVVVVGVEGGLRRASTDDITTHAQPNITGPTSCISESRCLDVSRHHHSQVRIPRPACVHPEPNIQLI